MSSCGKTITPPAITSVGDLEVVDKFSKLMEASLADGSIYEKSKDTFKYMFDDLNITEKEKAEVVAQNIGSMTSSITANAMNQAMQWAIEERDGAYKITLLEQQALAIQADVELKEEQICNMEADTCIKKANVLAISSASIRDNGRAATTDTCGLAVTLEDEGLKYEQTKQINSNIYAQLAKTYRESGTLSIQEVTNVDGYTYLQGYASNTDFANGYKDDGGLVAGYTNQQLLVAERQRYGFDDNQRQHVANSSAQMITGMIAAEVDLGDNGVVIQPYIDMWVDAIEYLNVNIDEPHNPSNSK